MDLLKEIGLPERLRQELHTMNESAPKLKGEELTDERRARAKAKLNADEKELISYLGPNIP